MAPARTLVKTISLYSRSTSLSSCSGVAGQTPKSLASSRRPMAVAPRATMASKAARTLVLQRGVPQVAEGAWRCSVARVS